MSATNLSCNDGFNDLNHAMHEFMLHHDNVRSRIDAVMSAYVRLRAVRVDCVGVAQAWRYLADTLVSPARCGRRPCQAHADHARVDDDVRPLRRFE